MGKLARSGQLVFGSSWSSALSPDQAKTEYHILIAIAGSNCGDGAGSGIDQHIATGRGVREQAVGNQDIAQLDMGQQRMRAIPINDLRRIDTRWLFSSRWLPRSSRAANSLGKLCWPAAWWGDDTLRK